MHQGRQSWDEYFMQIARLVASRSTCIKRKVGAVIVKDKRIITTGYNGPPSDFPHCTEETCLRLNIPSGEQQERCWGLHAEQNAIIQAAIMGVSIKEGTVYCTHQPCIICTKMLINVGIKRIVFAGEYPDLLAIEMINRANISMERFSYESNSIEAYI